jgi:hypothetical protein
MVDALTPACARLGLRVEAWAGDATLPALRSEPVLMMSMLHEGERQIPKNVAEAVSHQLPGVPLLLLTEEQLVQPWLELQQGRVSLIGAPLTDLRVSSLLQSLVTGRLGDRSAKSGANASSVRVNKTILGRAWVATIVSGQADGTAPMPALHAELGKGTLVVMGPDSTRVGELTALWQRGIAPVANDPSSVVIALNAEGTELYVECRRADVALWLASPDRAPRISDVFGAITRGGNPYLRIKAAPRDLLFAVWAHGAHRVNASAITDAMLDGGSPLAAAVTQSLEGDADPLVATIVEVR